MIPNAGSLLFTFAAGASQSDAQDISDFVAASFSIPSGFQGTSLTLLAAADSVSGFLPVHDDAGDEVTWTIAAGRMVVPADAGAVIAPLRWVKLRAGTTASPQTQSAARTVVALLKR